MNNERLTTLQTALKKAKMDVLLISDPHSIEYLLGKMIHPGERMLVLAVFQKQAPVFFLNHLFNVPEDFGFEKVWFYDTDDYTGMLASYLDQASVIGVDKNWPARFLLPIMANVPQAHFVNGSYLVDEMRMVKDEAERQLMREASLINDQAMADMRQAFEEGITENEMAAKLLEFYKAHGGEGYSFDPIVGYGPNGADGHHGCDQTPLKPGDSIVVDMGCMYQGYCSDMTRTFFYKSVTPKQREVYDLVLQANLAAEAIIKPGVRLCDIDKAARDVITKAGYGPMFNHRTGHFIGKEVHEYGDVSSAFDMPVRAGMIFSIEPGIYIEGEFGVRIEDLVLVTEDGCEILNHYPKDLIVIE
ncbi:Xaa-Pro dipeptidase [Clostridiales bacterium CHKCI006]|nr:Xaa-Pro dipeptidase [Clostridiales bacterium CHKCI006]